MLHYLRSVDAVGTDNATAVGRKMRELPVDYFGKPASIRSDGRVLYDLDVYRVKKKSEQTAPWDYYTPLRKIPAAEAFLPVNATACGG